MLWSPEWAAMTKLLRSAAFRHPGRDGQEDAVAEGDDGLLHQLLVIGAVRDVVRAGEEGGFQMGGDGGDVNHAVLYAQAGGLPGGAFQLPFRVVGGVVKAEGHPHAVVPVRPVQGYAGVQPPAEQYGGFRLIHGARQRGRFSGLCSAMAVSWMPPRGEKRPSTFSHRGEMAAARSSVMRLTICSLKAG